MKTERLRDEIDRILEIDVRAMNEHLSEWMEWDDEHGEHEEGEDLEAGENIPEGMFLQVGLSADDPEVKDGLIIITISGSVMLHRGQ